MDAAVSRRMILVIESSGAGGAGGGTLGGVDVRIRSRRLLISLIVKEGDGSCGGDWFSSLVVVDEVEVFCGEGESPWYRLRRFTWVLLVV